jgi:hypothetical protein
MLRPEGQPSPASRAREQETASLFVATLATTQGPVLICREHDHIPTIADEVDNLSPCRAPDIAREPLCRGVGVPEGSHPQGNAEQPRRSGPELQVPGDNAMPIS